MNELKQIKLGLLALMALAMITLAACDQLKNVYCTQVVPALTSACSSSKPAVVPLAEVK